jgi:hypothetical protein
VLVRGRDVEEDCWTIHLLIDLGSSIWLYTL